MRLADGVSARWRLEAYPGLATAHPALIAGVLYRDSPATATTPRSWSSATGPSKEDPE
jgi:hypothetical protein